MISVTIHVSLIFLTVCVLVISLALLRLSFELNVDSLSGMLSLFAALFTCSRS